MILMTSLISHINWFNENNFLGGYQNKREVKGLVLNIPKSQTQTLWSLTPSKECHSQVLQEK